MEGGFMEGVPKCIESLDRCAIPEGLEIPGAGLIDEGKINPHEIAGKKIQNMQILWLKTDTFLYKVI